MIFTREYIDEIIPTLADAHKKTPPGPRTEKLKKADRKLAPQ